MLRFISLGVGVQSSTVFEMALLGALGKIDFAVFADTQCEPGYVYEHLEYLREKSARSVCPVQIEIVTAGDLSKSKYLQIPAYVKTPSGGKMLMRSCTADYKIRPINQFVRQRLGFGFRKHIRQKQGVLAECLLGISTDEAQRQRDNRLFWIKNTYPLIDLRMTRQDCLEWLRSNGFRIPEKSACVFCPFHDDKYWRKLKTQFPSDFQAAVDYDLKIRDFLPSEEIYLHRSGVALDKISFGENQLDLFGNECDGFCCL